MRAEGAAAGGGAGKPTPRLRYPHRASPSDHHHLTGWLRQLRSRSGHPDHRGLAGAVGVRSHIHHECRATAPHRDRRASPGAAHLLGELGRKRQTPSGGDRARLRAVEACTCHGGCGCRS
jgi:hypothetical protein